MNANLVRKIPSFRIKFTINLHTKLEKDCWNELNYSRDYGQAHNDPATHRLINSFLLHAPATSRKYYEVKNVGAAVRAFRELSRLATLDADPQAPSPPIASPESAESDSMPDADRQVAHDDESAGLAAAADNGMRNF